MSESSQRNVGLMLTTYKRSIWSRSQTVRIKLYDLFIWIMVLPLDLVTEV